MAKPNYISPAFLIHRRAFKDSSLLLDFFTHEYGKIRLVGRGARQSKTHVQMFQHLNISFSGKRDLKTLTHWEINDIPRHITGEALIISMYINELISKLLPEQEPHSELFKTYQQFISQINEIKKNTRTWLLRLFENKLLAELGYEVDFSNDINGDKIYPNNYYDYQQQVGFMSNSLGKILGKTINSMHMHTLQNIPDSQQLIICRNLNRQRLKQLLNNKPLKSRSLFFTKS